jgi:signal transduction histidine kinase
MNQPLGNSDDDLQALQLTCDRLRQQCQFQAAFLGTASHELRAPINQIISLHQLILEDLCESPAEEREFVAQANQAIITVLKNLDTLINVSKLDIGALQPKFQAVELAPVFTTVQQLMEMKCINRHCRLTLTSKDNALTVQTDAQWLQQLLVTLVDAALAAGSTTIQLTAKPQDATTVGLELTCDARLEQWSLESLSSSPAPQPQLFLELPLSPGFAYQIAARMVHHLQGKMVQEVSLNPEQQQICITLPRV